MTVADAPPTSQTARGPEFAALAAIVGGTIMVVLDTTIVNVALPQIRDDLGVGSGVEWVVTAYLIGILVAQPLSAWLADRFGRSRVYTAMLGCFSLTSALVALSPDLLTLSIARFLQGLAGGGVMPLAMTMLLTTFPLERRSWAISVWGMATTVAPAFGPTLGGWIVTNVSWPWLFLINLPVGAVCVVLCRRVLPKVAAIETGPFDALGSLTGCGGLTLIVVALHEGNSWGWGSPLTSSCVLVGVAALAAFVRRELRVEHPLIDVRMFSYRSFALTSIVVLMIMAAHFCRLVFIPLELQELRDVSAFTVGLMLIPVGLSLALGMALGGRLLTKVGPRIPIVAGCVVSFAAFLCLGSLRLSTPLWLISALMSLQSIGLAVTFPPSIVAGLADLPDRLASQGSAVRSLTQQVGSILGVAGLTAMLNARGGLESAPARAQSVFNSLFLVAAVGFLVAALAALPLNNSKRVATVGSEPHVLFD